MNLHYGNWNRRSLHLTILLFSGNSLLLYCCHYEYCWRCHGHWLVQRSREQWQHQGWHGNGGESMLHFYQFCFVTHELLGIVLSNLSVYTSDTLLPHGNFLTLGWPWQKCFHFSLFGNSLSAHSILLFPILLPQYSLTILIHFTGGLPRTLISLNPSLIHSHHEFILFYSHHVSKPSKWFRMPKNILQRNESSNGQSISRQLLKL